MRIPIRTFSALVLFLILLSACAPQTPVLPTPTATSAVTETPTPTATLQPTATLTPTATEIPTATPTLTVAELPKSRYTLNVEFNYDLRHASVEEQIDYLNQSADTLTELRLMVPPMSYASVFSLRGLQWADGQPVENAGWSSNFLLLPLRQPLTPGQTASVKLAFDLALPSQALFTGPRPVPFGYTSRQVNLVDWYPFVPPYRSGQGWLAHPDGFYGEHLVYEVADFAVNLRLAGGRSDLVVAASAKVEQDGDTLRFEQRGVRNVSFSISHEYVVTRQMVGDVEIVGYAFPAHAAAGEAAAQTTAESLALYEELFGPYPHSTLAVVEADFLDGMEYDGLFFLSKAFYNLYTGSLGDYLIAIAAHETAHQWWYALVGSDQAEEPWLDEALSTYSERLYYERVHPDALGWWWDYRINYYRPSGWVDSSIYDHQGQPEGYRQYRDAVYLNGAVFFEELRQQMGDEAFLTFLKDYTQRYTGKVASADGFFETLSQYPGVDVAPLLERFFKKR